ncbi:MAG TPA: hypothetical protein VHW65_02050 [Gemmatimonadales bacterium]|jgi:Tol biopolymer transport system component|nr:hypothetical protein [Gemmatimonadales bacterium]
MSDREAAFAGGPLTWEIIAIDPGSGRTTDLTNSPTDELFPSASPDGQHVLYVLSPSTPFGEAVPMVMTKTGTGAIGMPFTCPTQFSCTGVSNGGVTNDESAGDDVGAAWLADGEVRFLVHGDSPASGGTTPSDVLMFNVPSETASGYTASYDIVTSLANRASREPTTDLEAYTRGAGLYTYRISTGQETQLAPACTFPTTCVTAPVWSVDGNTLYVIRQGAIWAYATNGSSGRELYSAAALSTLVASPDGKWVAFVDNESLKVLSLNGGAATPTLLFPTSATPNMEVTGAVAWSPDSKSLAFVAGGIGFSIWGVNVDGSALKEIVPATSVFGISWGP